MGSVAIYRKRISIKTLLIKMRLIIIAKNKQTTLAYNFICSFRIRDNNSKTTEKSGKYNTVCNWSSRTLITHTLFDQSLSFVPYCIRIYTCQI